MTTSMIILLAVLVDGLFGEPKRFHPLVGFGNIVIKLEKDLNPTSRQPDKIQILFGALATIFLLLLIVLPLYWIQTLFAASPIISILFSVFVLYFCIAYRSLVEHIQVINQVLEKNDISAARTAVSMIVSRNTEQLSAQQIASASIESALENTNDALFGALFWFALAGLLGVVVYRIVNTLDAMWGYRSIRFNYFGRVAARLDDLLNIIPARLSALSFALVGDTRTALHCWQSQASTWKSPNAGVVMAAGSGALKLQLGGPARYHGQVEERPILGLGAASGQQDIVRALKLIRNSLVVWLLMTLLIDTVITYA